MATPRKFLAPLDIAPFFAALEIQLISADWSCLQMYTIQRVGVDLGVDVSNPVATSVRTSVRLRSLTSAIG